MSKIFYFKKGYFFKKTALAGFVFLFLIGPGASFAFADPAISSEFQSTPNRKLTDDEQRALYLAGDRLLMHIDRARRAIQGKNREEASDNINKGLTLVQVIENSEPEYTVKTTIKSGNIVYQDENRVKPTWLPIYSELDEISMDAPIIAAKKESEKQAKVTKNPELTVDETLIKTKVKLDVSLAKNYLKIADEALKNGKPDDADKVLALIERDGVLFSIDERDRPLLQARENLMEAKTLFAEGKIQDTKVALQSASDAIAEYQAHAQGSRSGQAGALRNEINTLGQEIHQDNKDRQSVLKKITGLWDKLIHWF
ncbi:MAG: YfdX family protein [Nitrospiria bacterium]